MAIQGLNDYELRQKNDFLEKEGVHVVEVTGCKHFESNREPGQWFFCIDFTVLNSTSVPKGAARAHLIKVQSKYPDLWKKDVKGFITALVNVSGEDPEDQNYDALAADVFQGDSAEGQVLEVETRLKDPSDPDSFMKHVWRAPGKGAELIEESSPSSGGTFEGL